MTGTGLMPFKWRCLYLQGWVLSIMTQVISGRCMICTVLQNIIMVAKVCITLPIICGGEIKTLFHPTKNRMDKIVIGVAATVGCLPVSYTHLTLPTILRV